ncbi:MAG: DUF3501 family protein [Alphaproteobacteria bacterium]
MVRKHEITRADVIPMADYTRGRKERRRALVEVKKHRRVEVGPDCSFYFESYQTMWHQVHEMLFIEKGGEAQIADELSAYNPLIPKGRELVATVMFEIDDPVRRGTLLAKLGGVEELAFIRIGGETIKGIPEADVDRTNAAGKASSVQFIHFPFIDAQVAAFRDETGDLEVVVGFSHPEYAHMAVLPAPVRQALAEDFD